MMYSGSSVLQPPESGMGGNKRIPCPLHGCKRVYTDPAALESHIKDHEIAAQSLPGKVMLCSTVGCSGSFPNMQKLIEHMRHHHKPNIFFVCESCRTKLRSYRGLLTHLHTCSKVMRGKAKPTEPNMAPMEVDQKPPWLEAASAPSQILNPDPSFPAAVKPGPDGPPLLGPPFMSNLEPAPPHPAPPKLTEAAPQPPIRSDASDLTPSLHFGAPPLTPTQGQHPTQTRSPEDVHPAPASAPASAPRSPPGPSAVWRKNQGSCSSRILWEHTKGRYTCVQCGHMVISRKEMTQHISTKHSRNKAAEDTGSAATNT
ncbi:LOW QUALITY PROTEIN: zinc finger protein 414 [Trematomus bernacchii]|uniref:LOW QUALITY PROTEIN: zinc finger protein 414 n=1 Tax=Trematomus bernacchii TaxID=40690 RepID=UPI00146A5FEA|nr:LOW QUALITY PROTEIN: zinc finger protein 414 [Trematomus bernacchii]